MTQTWVVAVLVFVAAVYSVWYVLPKAARQRLGRVHRWLDGGPACGSCSDCSKCAAPPAVGTVTATEESSKSVTFQRKI